MLRMERWLSGRKHVPAKDAYPIPGYRGFESLSFRFPICGGCSGLLWNVKGDGPTTKMALLEGPHGEGSGSLRAYFPYIPHLSRHFALGL